MVPYCGAVFLVSEGRDLEMNEKRLEASINRDGTVEAGDFIFELDAARIKLYESIVEQIKDSHEYEKKAVELMHWHNEFYGQLLEVEEYVTRGAIISCGKGEKNSELGMLVDHGVLAPDEEPLMTCKDCTRDNIRGFGKCLFGNPKRDKEMGIRHHPKVSADGKYYECIPVLNNKWIQNTTGIYIVENAQTEEEKKEAVAALLSGAYLTCIYGGVITVVEVPGMKQECIIIDDWLKLYKKPTVFGKGRHVPKHKKAKNYDWAMEEELRSNGFDWFMTSSPAHDEIAGEGNMDVEMTSNNLYTDSEGRYWVAVGPNVMNPEHSKKRVQIDAKEMNYGTKLDIVVEDREGVLYYIPAVVGDAKEHSYPDGLYQTGIPFDLSLDEGDLDDRNTIEFIGCNIVWNLGEDGMYHSSINATNDYKLIEIIVYDGVFNYK